MELAYTFCSMKSLSQAPVISTFAFEAHLRIFWGSYFIQKCLSLFRGGDSFTLTSFIYQRSPLEDLSKSLVQKGRAVTHTVKCSRDFCMFVFKKAAIGLLI